MKISRVWLIAAILFICGATVWNWLRSRCRCRKGRAEEEQDYQSAFLS